MKTVHSLLCLLVTFFACQTEAFVSRAAVLSRPSSASQSPIALQERRWNFNDGQSPWGMKKNAELWNGRFAQVSSVVHQVEILLRNVLHLTLAFFIIRFVFRSN